jgi:hypothetical protein
MDNPNSGMPLNDTEEKTEVSALRSSRREFLCAAAATSGAVILSAEFLPETAGASTDKIAELVLPPATKAVTPFEVHVPEPQGLHAKRLRSGPLAAEVNDSDEEIQAVQALEGVHGV